MNFTARWRAVPSAGPELIGAVTRTATPLLPGADCDRLLLAVMEAFNNICAHGGTRAPKPDVVVHIAGGAGTVTVTLSDDGDAFDPMANAALALAVAEPADDPHDPLAESGRGLSILTQCADRLSYRREAGRNELQITVLAQADRTVV